MAEPDAPLPPLDLTPSAYAQALAIALGEEELTASRAAWRRALEMRAAPAPLPLAGMRAAPNAAALYALQRVMPLDSWREVKASAAARGVASTALVAACFAGVLGERVSAPAFSMDLHYFNRLPLHAQVRNIVGDFSAAMPLGFEPANGQTTIAALAEEAQRQIAALRAVGDISALTLQRESFGLSEAPTIAFTTFLGIDADYALTEAEDPVLGLPSFELTALPGAAIHCQALEHERGLLLTLHAYEGYCEEALVGRVADGLLARLGALTDRRAWEETSVPTSHPLGRQRSA
jgi:non-ribosomal peptide synthetase component F